MKRWHVALIASAILNLFLAGALAGGYVSLQGGRSVITAGSLRIAGAELPPGERRAYRTALRETRRAMRPTVLAARDAKVQAADLLAQPRVNPAAVLAALDRARAADIAVRAAVERRAVAFAVTLPPAERTRMAAAMRRRAARGGR